MTTKYQPAIFQPTVRPSWCGALAYISPDEVKAIFEAIIKFPEETNVKSIFWEETIKPDLVAQYDKFISTCEARGRGAKTYWGEHKLSLSNTKGNDKDNILKDKDKDNIKDNNKIYNHYGELGLVWLTTEDYNNLKSKYPNMDKAIDKLDSWLDTKPNGVKNQKRDHRGYFKQNSWVWDGIGTGETQQQLGMSDAAKMYRHRKTEEYRQELEKTKKENQVVVKGLDGTWTIVEE